jgi:hypothetical protein
MTSLNVNWKPFIAGLFFIATLAGLPFIIVTDFAILSLTAATKSD